MSNPPNTEAEVHNSAKDEAAQSHLADPQLEIFLARFERWCRDHGLAPSTVCMRVLGNSYAVKTMRNQARRQRKKIKRLEEHMLEVERRGSAHQHR